ncbi:MAG: TIGR03013 family XrtA/PEP-CTERM system glycosyltransferase [Desulfosoma sp.]|uniref:TIGR03013 family XrtA/PEP-CTERM system glycosyltransferase n=1 Tax=Desulfosoma sp. TaxID=2603217 RepID=UPI00404A586D
MLKILHTYFPIRHLLFFLGEGLLIYLGILGVTSLWLHGKPYEHPWRYSLWVRIVVITAAVQLSLYYHELYEVKVFQRIFDLAIRIVQALGVACILLALLYTVDGSLIIEQGVFFLALFVLLFVLVSWRFGYQVLCQNKILTEKILLIGGGQLASLLAEEIYRNLDSGYVVAGIVDKSGTSPLAERLGVALYRDEEVMCDIAREHGVRKIVVALDEKRGQFPLRALLQCKMMGLRVLDGVSFYEALSGKILVEKTHPSWLIFSDGFRRHFWTRVTKRALDIVLSSVGLLAGLPLMAVIACLIKATSPGPVLVRQERVGQNERAFHVLKFRTMCHNAEQLTGPVWACDKDPRVTPVGRILRALRLDELPQFWNVLVGEMSFVGPRPERPVFVQQLKAQLPYYAERHTVKPGITGWAQVNYGYGASKEDALKKLEYDLFYAKHMSLFLDLFIVLKTVKIVLFGKGAR